MTLGDWANVCSILTGTIALVGVLAYFHSVYVRYQKSKRLENFLRKECEKGPGHGQRSITRIIQDVGLTQDEILKLSFSNPNIRRRVTVDPITNLATELLFEYDPAYKTAK